VRGAPAIAPRAQRCLRLGKLGYVDSDGVFGMRKNTPWSAEHEGWSLHAGVTIAAGDEGRERLCRYVVRHALSTERMSWTKDGLSRASPRWFLSHDTGSCATPACRPPPTPASLPG